VKPRNAPRGSRTRGPGEDGKVILRAVLIMDKATDEALSPLVEAEEDGLLRKAIRHFRTASRLRRCALFHSLFHVAEESRILDLGGANGAYVAALLTGTAAQPANVYIADIDHEAVHSAATRFGYTPVFLEESGDLPFPDHYFDVVLCSSVLEHVTIPKRDVWRERSGSTFSGLARAHQRQFAKELSRVAVGYFVQVPSRWFPIETHTWLPFVGYLPRSLQCRVIEISNRVWIKETIPDFYLPTASDLLEYFPTAELRRERVFGVTKSLIAVKRPSSYGLAPRTVSPTGDR